MGTMASQITSLTIGYSTFYSGADQRKHQSSASLAFVWGMHRGPVNSPYKWPVTRKMFPFDDVIMYTKVVFSFCRCFHFIIIMMLNNSKTLNNMAESDDTCCLRHVEIVSKVQSVLPIIFFVFRWSMALSLFCIYSRKAGLLECAGPVEISSMNYRVAVRLRCRLVLCTLSSV